MAQCTKCGKEFKNVGSHIRFCKGTNEEPSILDGLKPLEDELKTHVKPGYLIDKARTKPKADKKEDKVIKIPAQKKDSIIKVADDLVLDVKTVILPTEITPQHPILNAWDYLAKHKIPDAPIIVPASPENVVRFPNPHTELTLDQMAEEAQSIPKPDILSSEVKSVAPTPEKELKVPRKKTKMPKWVAWLILTIVLWVIIFGAYLLKYEYKVI